MNSIKRKSKQTAIISIYLIIFFLLMTAFVFHFKSDPTCSDGKQNQGEKGVDCGGPCSPCNNLGDVKKLQIIGSEMVYDVDNKYDLAIKLKNSNQKIGAQKVTLNIKVLSENKSILAELKKDDAFILPSEEKYIFINGVELSSNPSKIEVKLGNVEWNKNIKLTDPDLVVLNKNYQRESGGSSYFGKVSGTLINNSNDDFNIVKVKVLLRDKDGKLLAINHQLINTLRSEEKRDFVILFPHGFSGSVSSLEVYPETNIYDKDNYLNPQHYLDYQDEKNDYK